MRFDIFTVVQTMLLFWVLAPCKLLDIYQRFGESYCIHLQGLSNPETLIFYCGRASDYSDFIKYLYVYGALKIVSDQLLSNLCAPDYSCLSFKHVHVIYSLKLKEHRERS